MPVIVNVRQPRNQANRRNTKSYSFYIDQWHIAVFYIDPWLSGPPLAQHLVNTTHYAYLQALSAWL